ncbi:semialdehyde dehydrogenase [Deinococcus depolymerans]|uniref:Polysaccharide biosynthesis protein n=1 Tax=Deinococcus depolymerans TaxID=392408 RepID=A0ABP3LQF2_9DEIO
MPTLSPTLQPQLPPADTRHPVAYLTHPGPQLARDLGRLFGPLGWWPDSAYRALLGRLNLPPFVTGTFHYRDRPERVAGWLILVPLTPDQLRAGGSRVHALIGRAVDRAAQLGARTVGLGSLLGPATGNGTDLRRRTDTGVTTGSAFTAAMALRAAQRLLTQCEPAACVALVGPGGSVGSCLARLLAANTDHDLLLIGQNEARLRGLQATLPGGRAAISTDLTRLRDAELVILTGRVPHGAPLGPALRRGSLVLDITRPRVTGPDLLLERPDVRVIDGGLVSLPGVDLPETAGWPRGLGDAALAETLLLGLHGHPGHFALGTPTPAQAAEVTVMARGAAPLGFTLAPPHSFGQPVTVDRRFDRWSCPAGVPA